MAFVAIACGGISDPDPNLYDLCATNAESYDVTIIRETLLRGCEAERDRRIEYQRDPEGAAEKDCINRAILRGESQDDCAQSTRLESEGPTVVQATPIPKAGDSIQRAIKFTFEDLMSGFQNDRKGMRDRLTGSWVAVIGPAAGTKGTSGLESEIQRHNFAIGLRRGSKVECIGKWGDTSIKDFDVLGGRNVTVVGVYEDEFRSYPVLRNCEILDAEPPKTKPRP